MARRIDWDELCFELRSFWLRRGCEVSEMMSRRIGSRVPSKWKRALRPAQIAVLGHTDYQRLAIVGHPRTGSNYLAAGLASLSCIKMYHEIFAEYRRRAGEDVEAILARLLRKEPRRIKVVGFKVFYKHLSRQEWCRLEQRRDFRIIHITRANKLRTVVSFDIACKTGEWLREREGGMERGKAIALDISSLVSRLEEIERYERLARARFGDRTMLEVVYEELVGSPDESFQEVTEYLDLDETVRAASIRLKRQNPGRLEDLIVNYDEVAKLLCTTRFAGWLDD